MDLTDQQWTIIEPLFEEKRRPDGRGRPWRDARTVLNGCCGSCAPARRGMTCRIATRRTRPAIGGPSRWRKNGVFRDLLTCLAEDLRLRGKIERGYLTSGVAR
jgi:transposase